MGFDLVLLGAGASKAAGIPLSRELVSQVSSRLTQRESEAFEAVVSGLSQGDGAAVDIEDVSTSLRTLGSRDRFLGALVREWAPSIAHLNSDDFLVTAEHVERAAALLTYLQPSQNEQTRYLVPLIKQAAVATQWIATLNFDNCIELAANVAGVSVDHGLPDTSQPPRFDGPEALKLIKLHGSATWLHFSLIGITGRLETASPNPDVRFGAISKLTARGPYLDLLLTFRERLGCSKSLLVIGYSFRDFHINHLIRLWAIQDPQRRMTVVDPFLSKDIISDRLQKTDDPIQHRLRGVEDQIVLAKASAEDYLSQLE